MTLKNMLAVIRTEPVLLAGFAQAVLALLATNGVHLSASQSGGILAATTAILTLAAAAATRPFQVSALTGLTSALVTLLVAFGVHGVQPGVVSTLNAAIVAGAAIVVRLHVSPTINNPAPPGTVG